MSVCACACGWDNDVTGDCVMRNRTARTIPKSGNVCPNCKCPVEIGQECIDHAGLDCDGGGWFRRFHRQCFGLMESFADAVCHGDWCYPFDIIEAAEHAAANGHEPFWRTWLLVYEETWAWTPEPSDPPPYRPLDVRWETYKAQQPEFKPTVTQFEKTEIKRTRPDVRAWKETT